MVVRYCIEDEAHAETLGDFETIHAALAELERLSRIPWDAEPNQAPCQSWRTCGRDYVIVEYDKSWRELRRVPALQIRSSGAVWDSGLRRE